MKQLIVNADDFGLTRGVSDGILEGHRRGLITSATIMVNMPAFAYAADGARACASLGVGVHLNLIDGRPVSACPLPGLVNEEGCFFGRVSALVRQIYLKRVAAATIETELRAQIEKALGHLQTLTHLDGHKHVHILPTILPSVLRLAKEYRIPCVRYPAERRLVGWRPLARARSASLAAQYLSSKVISWIALFVRPQFIYNSVIIPDHFFGVAHTGLLDREFLERLLCSLPDGVSELMCHPGYAGEDLDGVRTRLRAQRECELRALMDPHILALARKHNVALIHYGDLAKARRV